MLFQFDKQYYDKGFIFIAGIDEAGRGPLAGPVVAAAVIFPQDLTIQGVNDSKKLSPKKRNALFEEIKEKALSFSIAAVDNKTIDEINILQATFKAMASAAQGLKIKSDLLLIDGSHKIPQCAYPQLCRQEAIVSGDAKSASIAAASILAKVSRDAIMDDYAKLYPQYGFEKHKGYGTKAHIQAVQKFGPCPIHRMTFAPINCRKLNS
ncbi:MAG: ribonuclease HII [Endomicrobium sp.]|nr:ribonuclease HII [Endomicrobium sp.]